MGVMVVANREGKVEPHAGALGTTNAGRQMSQRCIYGMNLRMQDTPWWPEGHVGEGGYAFLRAAAQPIYFKTDKFRFIKLYQISLGGLTTDV